MEWIDIQKKKPLIDQSILVCYQDTDEYDEIENKIDLVFVRESFCWDENHATLGGVQEITEYLDGMKVIVQTPFYKQCTEHSTVYYERQETGTTIEEITHWLPIPDLPE